MKPSLIVKDINVRVAAFLIDDLIDTIFAGHHQPLGSDMEVVVRQNLYPVGILYNLSNTCNPPIITNKLAFLMTTILAFFVSSFMFLLSNVARESVELPEEKCEELLERACPTCGSMHLIKNGSVRNGKPKHQCKRCDRQFVANPTKITVSKEIKEFIDRLLLERIFLRGIARVAPIQFG